MFIPHRMRGGYAFFSQAAGLLTVVAFTVFVVILIVRGYDLATALTAAMMVGLTASKITGQNHVCRHSPPEPHCTVPTCRRFDARRR